MSPVYFARTLRTPSSERFLIHTNRKTDIAALDLHFLANGNVAGTLVLLDESIATEEQISELLAYVDESLLPMASFNEKNLSFTVVRGTVVGNYCAVGMNERSQ